MNFGSYKIIQASLYCATFYTRPYQTNDTDDNILLKTKYFVGDNYEIEVDAEGHQRKLHYLNATNGIFAIFVQENESENMYYIHKDYLGSFQSITDEDGELVEKHSFDPWGRRRNADDWTFNNVPPSFTFDRGYTGHEHLDQFGLINMNGRVYDPFVARFLSPDPFVQNANNTQGFNRYSYVSNNPLKFTDPSGYSYKPIYWKKSNPATILVPFGPGFIGTGLVNFSNHGSSYYYNHNTNTYYNAANGQGVNYQEVYDNYIVPNSAELPSNVNINSIEIGQKNSIDGVWYTTSAWDPMARLPGEELSGVMAGTVTANFVAFGAAVASNGGGDGSLAMEIASGSAIGFGLATSLRYKLEWEYLRQARINRAISGDFSKPIKHSLRSIRWAGSGFTLAGGIIGGVNFAMSDKSWGDYGQLGISMLSTGLTLGSATAPIGIGIGVIDAFGGFNGFYNYLDNQQSFYNNTGGIMVPVNGIPSFIPLK
jgi:RHS repeat-associated protein